MGVSGRQGSLGVRRGRDGCLDVVEDRPTKGGTAGPGPLDVNWSRVVKRETVHTLDVSVVHGSGTRGWSDRVVVLVCVGTSGPEAVDSVPAPSLSRPGSRDGFPAQDGTRLTCEPGGEETVRTTCPTAPVIGVGACVPYPTPTSLRILSHRTRPPPAFPRPFPLLLEPQDRLGSGGTTWGLGFVGPLRPRPDRVWD